MKKFLQKKLKNEKGMTLIELLAVIVIIAIIAAIAIPAIGNIIDNSRQNAVKADVQNVLSAANLYFTEEGTPDAGTAGLTVTGGVASGDLGPYIDDPGNVTSATVSKLAAGNEITATVVANDLSYTFTGYTNNELAELTPAQVKALGTAVTTP